MATAGSSATAKVRSPADLLRLVVAATCLLVLLLLSWLFGDSIAGFVADVLAGFEAVPEWLVVALVVGVRLLTLAVVVAGLLWTAIRDRWGSTTSIALAAALTGVLVALFDALIDVDPVDPALETDLDLGALSRGWFPSPMGIALVAAGLAAAAPWLSRNWRRAGWTAVAGLLVVHLLASATPLESLRGIVVGWCAGAAALVALGAPSQRPTPSSIADGLASVGLAVDRIEAAKVDARGSTPYFAVAATGERLFVKALGRDERSADLLFRLYRRIQRRDLGDERPFSSLRRAIEHEALLALAARDLGVQTPRLRAVADAEPHSFVLAYDAIDGRSLDRVDPAELTDDVLGRIWSALALLRHHRIAHRDLRLANLFLAADGEVWIIDFGFSELAASDLLLANDVAELVASSAAYVGVERAVGPANDSVDAATIDRAVARLHPWALSGATRSALKQQPGLLDELRRALGRS